MLQPANVPLTQAELVADLLIRLEEAQGSKLILTSLGVRRLGAVEALVIVHSPEGRRERVSAEDARLMARCLRDEHAHSPRLVEWAESLESAADSAERQASAILMALGTGRPVAQARHFRVR